jgi:hypothetical protein
MGKIFIILILSIAILGGGFYAFVNYYQEGETIVVNEGNEEDGEILNQVQDDSINEIEWIVYNYVKNGLSFTTKMPKEDWEVVEQDIKVDDEDLKEINIIFTNNNSCQLLYTFDLESSNYNFDLSNNEEDGGCAKVLQKVIAYASVPKFSADFVIADDDSEDDEELVADEDEDNEEEVIIDEDDEEEEEEEILNQVQDDSSDNSSGTSDDTLEVMTSDERYKSVKTFTHDYLTEYAQRHWDIVKKSLSKKALVSLGSDSLSEVVTQYYYYELLTLLTEVSEEQYKTTVKLTDKEENSISDGSGVYKLNIIWEDGGWKIDNYIFD